MDKVCIVTTLSAPLHETISFVNYHIHVKVDHLFLFFDNPDDPSIFYLEKYNQVTCVKCDNQYWMDHGGSRPQSIEDRQVFNANNAATNARLHNFDWIIHIDSDELIYPDININVDTQGLNNAGVSGLLTKVPDDVHVIQFDIREAVPDRLHYDNVFKEISLFKVSPSEAQEIALLKQEYKHVLFHGEYFRGHKSSKTAVRLSAPIKSMGLSSPVGNKETDTPENSGKLVIMAWRAFKLLHFDCCEYEAWKTKWIRRLDGTATASYMRPNRDLQLEVFRDRYTENTKQLVELYKSMYFLPDGKKEALFKLGVLTHIQLDKSLFDCPEL